jgi:hypothetical protein
MFSAAGGSHRAGDGVDEAGEGRRELPAGLQASEVGGSSRFARRARPVQGGRLRRFATADRFAIKSGKSTSVGS